MTACGTLWSIPIALAASLLVTAAGAEPASPAAIEVRAFMFSPTTLTVAAGTRVTWQNRDPEPHTVASVDGKFRSGALDEGDSFSFKFDAPGTYRYVCSIHPQMVGTVVVTGAKR
jgi:plastocyanin